MRKLCLSAIASLLLLSSCGGGSGDSQPSGPAVTTHTPTGEEVYKKTCIACHQAGGEGVAGAFPPLAKSDYLADREATIKQVLKGSTGDITVNGKTYNGTMPPQSLSDAEIAAVLTYVYSNFGNNACTITPGEVQALRAK